MKVSYLSISFTSTGVNVNYTISASTGNAYSGNVNLSTADAFTAMQKGTADDIQKGYKIVALEDAKKARQAETDEIDALLKQLEGTTTQA